MADDPPKPGVRPPVMALQWKNYAEGQGYARADIECVVGPGPATGLLLVAGGQWDTDTLAGLEFGVVRQETVVRLRGPGHFQWIKEQTEHGREPRALSGLLQQPLGETSLAMLGAKGKISKERW